MVKKKIRPTTKKNPPAASGALRLREKVVEIRYRKKSWWGGSALWLFAAPQEKNKDIVLTGRKGGWMGRCQCGCQMWLKVRNDTPLKTNMELQNDVRWNQLNWCLQVQYSFVTIPRIMKLELGGGWKNDAHVWSCWGSFLLYCVLFG